MQLHVSTVFWDGIFYFSYRDEHYPSTSVVDKSGFYVKALMKPRRCRVSAQQRPHALCFASQAQTYKASPP